MKKLFLHILFSTIAVSIASAQTNLNWKFLRPSNTGIGAEEHNSINGDKFGNIWTTGRSAIQGEGAVIRFNHADTIFTSWSNFEGYLPSEFVYEAEVDHNDHLWVATGEGLCKYDGVNWIVYNTTNTPLPSDHVRSITFDAQHNVWITFQEVTMNIGGIAKFDGTNWTVYTPGNSGLPNYQCSNILIDSQNNKWINSTFSVTKFDGLNFIDYNWQNSGLYGPQVYDIALDSTDRLFAITDLNGIYVQVNIFDGISWTYMNHTNTPAFSNYMFENMYIKDDKMIFAESIGSHAVVIYDGANWNTYFGGDMITDAFIDKDDNFWVSGISTLSKLQNGQWRDYERYSTGLAEHHQYDIFVDSHNRLWAANGNGGIQVFDCPKWQSYGPFNQGLYPSPQNLSTVGATTCEDSFGNIWFAYNSTNGTVVKIPNGDYQHYAAWEVFDLSNSPVSWIESSIADGFGNVFFYSDYGTYMYNNNTNTWTSWDLTNSPLQYYTYGFGKDAAGKVYFGGFQQLAIYDNGSWSSINLTAMGAAISVVNGIEFDSQNRMWLATDEGVWRHDGLSWTQWNTLNSVIPADHVTSIDINQGDSVFVSAFNGQGFLTGGISIFNGASWTTLNIANSYLPGEQIYDIALDTYGNLYINTFGQGVTVYNGSGVEGFSCIDKSLQIDSLTAIPPSPSFAERSVFVYPNPANDRIQIVLPESELSVYMVSIYSIEGSLVYNNSFQSNTNKTISISLNRNDISAGIYTIRLASETESYINKLVIH